MEVSPALAGPSYRTVTGIARVPGARARMRRTPLGGMLDLEALHSLFRMIERLDKVVIAAINGQALSIGCELALACDLRYIADDARAIGLPEITLGVLPGAGGTQRLARTVGPARALELILEAQLLTPDEALAAGLVHRVIPHDRLVPEAVETAHRLGPARHRSRSQPRSARCGRARAARSTTALRSSGSGSWPRCLDQPPAGHFAATTTRCRRTGRAPWEDAATRDAWSEGDAVDLLAEED